MWLYLVIHCDGDWKRKAVKGRMFVQQWNLGRTNLLLLSLQLPLSSRLVYISHGHTHSVEVLQIWTFHSWTSQIGSRSFSTSKRPAAERQQLTAEKLARDGWKCINRGPWFWSGCWWSEISVRNILKLNNTKTDHGHAGTALRTRLSSPLCRLHSITPFSSRFKTSSKTCISPGIFSQPTNTRDLGSRSERVSFLHMYIPNPHVLIINM